MPIPQTFNEYEVDARAVKVNKLLDTIGQMSDPARRDISAMIVANTLPDSSWELLGEAAGVRFSDPKTRTFSPQTKRTVALRLWGG